MKYRVLLISFLIAFFAVPKANAFTISPLRYQLVLDPGAEETVWVKVKNSEKERISVRVGIAGAKQNASGQLSFVDNYDIAESWLSPDKENLILDSGQEESVNFKIIIPKNAPPGEHFLGLYAQSADNDQSMIGLRERLICSMSLKVSGTANELVEVESWDNSSSLNFAPTVQFPLRIRNKGNVEVSISARLKVMNNQEQIVRDEKLEIGNKIWPQVSRDIDVAIDMNNFWPGWYEAHVEINYGLTKQTVVVYKRIWYVNQAGVLVIGVLVFLLALFIYGLYRLQNKKQKKYAQSI